MSFSQNDNDTIFEKLTAYCLNELKGAERAEVERWIQASTANARQYEHVQQLLQSSTAIEDSLDINVESAWQLLNDKLGPKKDGAAKVRRMTRYWLVAAAMISGLLIGGWFFYQQSAGNSAEWIAKTGFDSLFLPDGTMVLANGKSTVKYRNDFNNGNRDVQLEGNAFFSVHRDSTQPFSVEFTDGQVTVLGTQFHIEQKPDGFSVKVTEGKVKAELRHAKGEAILTRGRMATYTKENHGFKVESFADAVMLRYNNESLQTVLKDIFLARGIRVDVDEELAKMKLTVDFAQSNDSDILQALELLTQGSLKKTGSNRYQLTKN